MQEQTKFRWTPQALFLVKRAGLTVQDIRECEEYFERVHCQIGGMHVHDWLNAKFKETKPGEPIEEDSPERLGLFTRLLNTFKF